jgi:hypothetical protein
VLTLLSLTLTSAAVALSWRYAAPRDGKPVALRWHVRTTRVLAPGSYIGKDDIRGVLDRVDVTSDMVGEPSDVVGHFTTKLLAADTRVTRADVANGTMPPPTSHEILFPVVVSRSVAHGLRVGMSVVLVRDTLVVGRVADSTPTAGFVVSSINPSVTDSASETLLLRVPTAMLDSAKRLATPGWTPVIVNPSAKP